MDLGTFASAGFACFRSSSRSWAGDDTPIGWVTTAAYFVTATAAFLAGSRAKPATFWRALGVLLVLLGINKQLDLQTPFLHGGRHLLEGAGLGSLRRVFRVALLLGVTAVAIAVALRFARILRTTWRRNVLPLAGLLVLLFFVLLRAATFNHVDLVVGGEAVFRSGTLAALLELGGIGLILLGALFALAGGSRGRR